MVSAFRQKVAALVGADEQRIEHLAGGDLSEVLRLSRADGSLVVAKGGPAPGSEAAMLRALGAAGVPAPLVEGEHDGVLLIEHVANDGLFSIRAWADIGRGICRLHDQKDAQFGWPVDYALGTVQLDNRQGDDWPRFWMEQRLVAAASLLDRPWRDRVDALARQAGELLPDMPPPSLLHGDLWSGNILVNDGRLAALIDPACYYGDGEVDLAMLTLFDTPPEEFWDAYGPLRNGWERRRPLYQLFPALVHLRLFGAGYAALANRLLEELGV